MTETPFRWAPTTLISRSVINVDTTILGHNGKCTRAGLKSDYLILHLPQEKSGEDDVT